MKAFLTDVLSPVSSSTAINYLTQDRDASANKTTQILQQKKIYNNKSLPDCRCCTSAGGEERTRHTQKNQRPEQTMSAVLFSHQSLLLLTEPFVES